MAYQATGNRPVGMEADIGGNGIIDLSYFPNFFILPDNNGGSFVPE